MIWNEQEKVVLFITPNMKINSFIFDEKEGYLFFDHAGKEITYSIPSLLTEDDLNDGQIDLQLVEKGKIQINKEPLTKEDIQLLRNL